jgi:L-asparaginase/beta-aspartyl-peptidase (threonine type)
VNGAIVTHCGVGARADWVDSVEAAGNAGLRVLESGGSALDAVEAAIVILEDDERLNAGIGSRYQLDGVIRMDAALMDSDLEGGAVASIEGVRHPISVARKVMESPHVLLAGQGATAFARKEGFEAFDPATEATRKALTQARRRLSLGRLPEWAARWKGRDWRDTVGAVARDAQGRFAAGSSTGGTSWMLPGRVGDTPIIGAGLYAGPLGAVTATGIGEEIVRQVLSKQVYDDIAAGVDAQRACEQGLTPFSDGVPIGLIAITSHSVGAANNRKMPWWVGETP